MSGMIFDFLILSKIYIEIFFFSSFSFWFEELQNLTDDSWNSQSLWKDGYREQKKKKREEGEIS